MQNTPIHPWGDKLSADNSDPVERYLFLLLYSPGPRGSPSEPIKGDLWLQKELFLVAQNFEPLREEFEAYRLGPFSEAVEEYESQLRVSQFIDVAESGIRLTEKGQSIAKEIWESADEKERDLVKYVKMLLNDLSRDELLVLIYSSFEESTVNSDIRAEVESKRRDVAVSLFRKHKVSLERAARIARLPVTHFMKLLKARGIPAYEPSDAELKEELLGAAPNRH